MRIAIISDIHGNYIALEATLKDINTNSVDQIVCLGDVATSGPQPHQTIERLRMQKCLVVSGNMDDWLLNPTPLEGQADFYRFIEEINQWCSEQLTEEDYGYLESFQDLHEICLFGDKKLLCYHGSPQSNTDFFNVSTPDDELARMIGGQRALVMAGGHTHVQMLRRYENSILINPGSVGLPYERSQSENHKVPWAEYAILDIKGDQLSIEFKRVPVDLTAVFEVVQKNGMPHGNWWIHH
ncbi:metallophosphoesterase family protein [Chloroflexota bacterium]